MLQTCELVYMGPTERENRHLAIGLILGIIGIVAIILLIVALLTPHVKEARHDKYINAISEYTQIYDGFPYEAPTENISFIATNKETGEKKNISIFINSKYDQSHYRVDIQDL